MVAPGADLVGAGPATSIRPPWTRRRIGFIVLGVVTAVAVVAAARPTGVSAVTLRDGLSTMAGIARRAVPPRWDDVGYDLSQAWITLCTAISGTVLAAVLSLPVAVLAARTTTPSPVVGVVARALIVATRAVPDLVFALVFALALGIGPLPGVLALGVHSVGMIGRLLTDALEELDPGPAEALVAAGARRSQVLAGAVLRQVVPAYASTVLYRLEINVRQSVVLGLVGAGGIGFVLQGVLEAQRWPTAFGLVLIIVAMVVVVEQVSVAVRARLTGPGRPGAAVPVPTAGGRRPITGRTVATGVLSLAAVATLVVAASVSRASPAAVVEAVPDLIRIGGRLLPPDWSVARTAWNGLVEGVEIGLVGTALGLAGALPVSLLAARNVAPARWVMYVTRNVLVLVRALPELAVAVIFVAAVGEGPFAGVLTLAVSTFGFGAKLIADALERESPGGREAVASAGATRAQQTFAATVPATMPAIVGACIYCLDISLRASVVLGIVGAGGIGFAMEESIRLLDYQKTSTYLLGVFVLVYVLELLSVRVRRALT